LIPVLVCKGQLAFPSCSPSILKIKPSSSSIFNVCKVTLWSLGGLV
jgi:hypothetical protein